MPNGRVQRIDQDRGTAYIARQGRLYPAPLSELETKARVPGARVLFSVIRSSGEESASDVKLRAGTRTGRRQRRFGDLTGAKHPGAKVATTASELFGIDVTTQPTRVAQAWAQAVTDSDTDGATSLYLPDAVVHTPADEAEGRGAIRRLLSSTDFADLDLESAQVNGYDRAIRLTAGKPEAPFTTWFVIEQGAIAEQWIGCEPSQSIEYTASQPIHVVVGDRIDPAGAAYAEKRLIEVAERVDRQLLFGRIKLRRVHNRDRNHLISAEATLEWPHLLIRAHAASSTMTEAVDLVSRRLHSRLEHAKRHPRALPKSERLPEGLNAAERSDVFSDTSRSQGVERELVRHKSFAPEDMTVDEAAWDMALLDYDFFLFVDLATGQDTLLERAAGGDLTLRNVTGEFGQAPSTVNDIEIIERVAGPKPVSTAMDYLDQSDDSRLFFLNTATNRANVIYRRHDGHFGLITPPVDE